VIFLYEIHVDGFVAENVDEYFVTQFRRQAKQSGVLLVTKRTAAQSAKSPDQIRRNLHR
jgi:hypothetical protein